MIKKISCLEKVLMQRISPQESNVQTHLCIVNELHRFAYQVGRFRKEQVMEVETQVSIAKVVNSVHRTT